MTDNNPCLTCGACCAYFRVSFFWGEAQSAGGSVPDELLVPVSPTYVAMQGTQCKPARCSALRGKIGEQVHCTIYAERSTTCQNFHASWYSGEHSPDCDEARKAHGLAPLEKPNPAFLQPSQS